MGMTATELEHRMSGKELVEHVAEMHLTANEQADAQKQGTV